MSSNDFPKRFLSFVRSFQERNQFIVRAYNTDFLPVESHIITEIANHHCLTGAELAAYLNLSPARISLLLKNLEMRKIITLQREERSSTRKPYALTSAGHRAMKELDNQADQQLETMTMTFSKDEITQLSNFFRLLSDGVGAPVSKQRSDEHPLRFVVRRLTRWLGQLGNNFFQSGISPLDWHILLAIHDGEGIVNSSALSQRFNASKQHISKSLKRLEQNKMISARVGVVDRRQRMYRLSKAGNELLNSLETRSARIVSKVVRQIPLEMKTARVIKNAYTLVGLEGNSKEIIISELESADEIISKIAYFKRHSFAHGPQFCETAQLLRRWVKKSDLVGAIVVETKNQGAIALYVSLNNKRQKSELQFFLFIFNSSAQKNQIVAELENDAQPLFRKFSLIISQQSAVQEAIGVFMQPSHR